MRVAEDVTQLGEELATALRVSRRTWYKTLRGSVTTKVMDPFERQAALHLMRAEGRALVGVGDDGVRMVLGIPMDAPGDLAKAPDFLSVTRGNDLALSEAKGGALGKAIAQLTNAMEKLKELGLAGDVKRIEIMRRKGASLGDSDLRILNGYLVKWSTGERVKLKGFNLFVRVIEL